MEFQMTLETEALLDRRALRRRLTTWRAAAIGVAVLALGAIGTSLAGPMSWRQEPVIARVVIEGMITDDRDRLRMLERLATNNSVQGVLLYINSPGGTTMGGEALYEGIRKLADKKPVVAQFGTTAASAGYMVGIAADHIVARGNTITGSVGVIMQWPEVSQLMDKLGVKVNEIKSGDLKAEPSLFAPVGPGGRQVAEEMIGDMQRWFLGLVAERRGFKTADVPGLEQGRVYTGRDALKHRLIDALGGEQEAVDWLKKTKGVEARARVVEFRPQRSGQPSLSRLLFRSMVDAVFGSGNSDVTTSFETSPAIERFRLDGFVSVWHPSGN
jgi:protease IV